MLLDPIPCLHGSDVAFQVQCAGQVKKPVEVASGDFPCVIVVKNFRATGKQWGLKGKNVAREGRISARCSSVLQTVVFETAS